MNIDFSQVVTAAQKAEKQKADTLSAMTAAVQGYLDTAARERGYDGILSLCSYATSTDPVFAAEGQSGVNYRDAVWRKCYEVLAAVGTGERQPPTEAELLSELPAMVWPG